MEKRNSVAPCCSPSARKVMVTEFSGSEGVILLDMMHREMTINSDAYVITVKI
jgi:hypothetical protein